MQLGAIRLDFHQFIPKFDQLLILQTPKFPKTRLKLLSYVCPNNLQPSLDILDGTRAIKMPERAILWAIRLDFHHFSPKFDQFFTLKLPKFWEASLNLLSYACVTYIEPSIAFWDRTTAVICQNVKFWARSSWIFVSFRPNLTIFSIWRLPNFLKLLWGYSLMPL